MMESTCYRQASCLKRKGREISPVEVFIKLDVFRAIFSNATPQPSNIKGYSAYSQEDFETARFEEGWHYLVNETGVGRQLVFPVLIKTVVLWSEQNFKRDDNQNLVQIPRFPVEKCLLCCVTDAYKL